MSKFVIPLLVVGLLGQGRALGTPAADSSLVPAHADRDSAPRAARPNPQPAADSLAYRLVFRATVASGEEGSGRVVEPAGLATDAFGRVMITDAQLHRVQRFDRDGRWMGESGALGSAAGELRRPGSVAAFGATGMAVLDQENRRVLLYDLFGQLQGTLLDLALPELESKLGRVEPGALAADRGGGLYLSDPARERVLVFDGAGQFVRALGGFGVRAGLFRGVRGLATTPRGEVVVTERLNARVQRLDGGGRPAASWPLTLERRPAAGLPVAVDEKGRVAVADEAGGRLWVFDPDGRKLAETAGLGRPRALAFAPDGTLLVAEAAPARVRRFALVAAAASAGESGK